ncbi:MAG: DUF805 domain-containing protein [Eubacterium sp.]|nr:DUF805 domain-containing protein [Eubacterium sp.]
MAPKKSFKEAYQLFLENIFNFNGRTRRSDFWPVAIVNAVAYSIVSSIISGILGADNAVGSIIVSLLSIGLFVVELALVIRRLHDTGKEWTYYLWVLLPLIGSIIVFIALVSDSQSGVNKFGPNPKEAFADPNMGYAPQQNPYDAPIAPPAPPINNGAPVEPVFEPVAPVAEPVAPVAEPVAPVAEPATPVEEPVVEAPTEAPVEAPIEAPAEAPTEEA